MSMEITVAVDAMGGDHGAHVTVPAALRFLKANPEVNVVLVGLEDAIKAELKARHAQLGPRLRVHHATEVVAMDEQPQLALKNKKDSSMRVAINLVKNGEAQACVSAGNTGALMATARFVLKMLPGIERPAIAKMIPNVQGQTCVLDLGANIDSTPEQLLQFAVMGSSLYAAVQHVEKPTVGLLNIGSEDMKGTETIKQAAELLRASSLNFHGNAEGNDIFKGTFQVVVCDGFMGNVVLKSVEGLAKMMGTFLLEEFTRSWWRKLIALIAMPVLNGFKRRVDPNRFNGASLLGLRGIVVKSHGGAKEMAFYYAMEQALEEVRSGVIHRIAESVSGHSAIATDTLDV